MLRTFFRISFRRSRSRSTALRRSSLCSSFNRAAMAFADASCISMASPMLSFCKSSTIESMFVPIAFSRLWLTARRRSSARSGSSAARRSAIWVSRRSNRENRPLTARASLCSSASGVVVFASCEFEYGVDVTRISRTVILMNCLMPSPAVCTCDWSNRFGMLRDVTSAVSLIAVHCIQS